VYVTPLVQLVVDEWQPSHEVTPLWMVVVGLDVNPKVLEKWQVAQGPGGDTLAWYLPFAQITVPLWQVEQSVVAVTPIWLPDMPMAPPLFPCAVYAPPWQDLQVEPTTWVWSIVTEVVKFPCDLWQ
jgi:hypothetical protein